jgi:hypothetical protein
MTDRYHSLTVVLGKDVREDDCQPLIDAIRHMRGVIDVSGNVSGFDDIGYMRARNELSKKLWKVLWPNSGL